MKKLILILVVCVFFLGIGGYIYYQNNYVPVAIQGQTITLKQGEEISNKEAFKQGFLGLENKKGEKIAGEDEVVYDVASGSVDTSKSGAIEGTIVYNNTRLTDVVSYEIE